jgi:hypothetical protein
MSCIKPKSNTVYSPKSDPYENTVADWMNETLKKEPLISVPKGIFFVQLQTVTTSQTKKIIVF